MAARSQRALPRGAGAVRARLRAAGFAWIDCNDSEGSALSFSRHARRQDDLLVVACNFAPLPRYRYRIGVPRGCYWSELLNSDASEYGGSGVGNLGGVASDTMAWHGHAQSIEVTLPPLGIVLFKPDRKLEPAQPVTPDR